MKVRRQHRDKFARFLARKHKTRSHHSHVDVEIPNDPERSFGDESDEDDENLVYGFKPKDDSCDDKDIGV